MNKSKLKNLFVFFPWAILICGALVVLLIYRSLDSVASGGEVERKDAYSFLQEVEKDHRATKAEKSIFVNEMAKRGFSALGVKSGDTKFPRTWIILNKAAPDGRIFKMPAETGVRVSCEEVQALRAKEFIDEKVLSFLTTICVK